MLAKRSFLKRLAGVVAAIALAPEIAFSRKLEVEQPKLDLMELMQTVYDLARARKQSDAPTYDFLVVADSGIWEQLKKAHHHG